MTASTCIVIVAATAIALLVGRAISTHLPPTRSALHAVDRRPQRIQLHRGHRRAGTVVVALAIAVVAHPAVALGALVTVAAIPRVRRIRRQRRQIRAVHGALPDAIELLVLLVQAGLTPHHAVEVMAERGPEPTRHGFAAVVTALGRGAALADALPALPATVGAEAASIADALGLATRHGLPLGPTLEQLARDARLRRRRQAEADARTLPVRLSFPLVACTLPSFVLVAIAPAVLAALSSLGDTTL